MLPFVAINLLLMPIFPTQYACMIVVVWLCVGTKMEEVEEQRINR